MVDCRHDEYINVDHLQEEVEDGLDGGELSTQMRGKVRLQQYRRKLTLLVYQSTKPTRFLAIHGPLHLPAIHGPHPWYPHDVVQLVNPVHSYGIHLLRKLMDIDKRGILVVNYSERLVILLREVRQLCELGHSIPSKIYKVGFVFFLFLLLLLLLLVSKIHPPTSDP